MKKWITLRVETLTGHKVLKFVLWVGAYVVIGLATYYVVAGVTLTNIIDRHRATCEEIIANRDLGEACVLAVVPISTVTPEVVEPSQDSADNEPTDE